MYIHICTYKTSPYNLSNLKKTKIKVNRVNQIMSLTDTISLDSSIHRQEAFSDSQKCNNCKGFQEKSSNDLEPLSEIVTLIKSMALPRKHFENLHSRSSDSGKSSSCSPMLHDLSYDSGAQLDDSNKLLRMRIQQCTNILLSLELKRENFSILRNRLSKISGKRKELPTEHEDVCNVCCLDIDQSDDKTFVKCAICQKFICRNLKCASWSPESSQWECELCKKSEESRAQTSSWVAEQISFHQDKLLHPPRARSEIYIPISDYNGSSMNFESVSQIGANSTLMTADQKHKIREYVEEIVAEILGGNLDTIAINQLSKNENYSIKNTTCDNKYTSFDTDAPDLSAVSEARLRQMIQKIIAETISLPTFSSPNRAVSEIALDTAVKMPSRNGFHQRHRTEKYFEPKIYQDLLATAVLNKIVDKKLNRNLEEERKSSENKKFEIGQKDLDNNLNIENMSTTSGSSVEPHSDCSYTDMEQSLNANEDKSFEFLHNIEGESTVSDYLANHMVSLPDIMAVPTEDDYISVTSSAIGDGNWENNWLFRKRKHNVSGSATISSAAMLVPDPTEDVRAQIGDKTADEVSDLSELGSDADDSMDSLLSSKLEPLNNRLTNKHLIGGENDKIILDELIERSSIVSNSLPTKEEELYTNALNELVVNAPRKNEAINDNVKQQETELLNDNCGNKQSISPPIDFNDINSNSLEGSIAEREYKKWYNAVEMPNNPYAPEALKRRISGSQERFIDLPNISPVKELNTLQSLNTDTLDADETQKREIDYKRYSRDYYINSSSTSSQSTPVKECSAHKEDYTNEVNNKDSNKRKSYENINDNVNTKHTPNDCLWTLSTPVRRSSSLKLLNNNIASSPSPHLHDYSDHQHYRSSCILQPRPSTSNSNYRHSEQTKYQELDIHSQRSWRSSSDISRKRSTLSVISKLTAADSSKSSHSSHQNNCIDQNVLTQFEKQLLHKDLKRNSLRAVSATTKDFVLNPLYESDRFFQQN